MSRDILTREDYDEFVKAFDAGLQGLEHVSSGLCPSCSDCADEYGMDASDFAKAVESGAVCEEPHFSWNSCDCCGGTLGGNREVAHGIDEDGNLHHFHICEDCVYYLEYGHLDDMTMLRIEENA